MSHNDKNTRALCQNTDAEVSLTESPVELKILSLPQLRKLMIEAG